MEGNCDYLFDDNLECTISRFQEMLKERASKFFDVHEFEDIIDYYTRQHHFEYAEEAIQCAVQQHPGAVSIKLKEARLWLEKEMPEQAIHLLNKLEHIEYSNHEVFFLKGLAQLLLNNFSTSLSLLDKAISLAGDDKDEILYQTGINLVQFGFHDKALEYFQEAHKINNSHLPVIFELASTHEYKQNYEQSAGYYQKYLDIDPFAESIWNSLGQIYLEQNLLDEAEEAFEFAVSINPMYTTPYYNKGLLYEKRGHYKEAIGMYKEIVPVDGDNPMLHHAMGNCCKNTGDFHAAMKHFKKAVSLDETHAETWYAMGNICCEQKRFKESIKHFEKALSFDRENPHYWFSLGNAFKNLNKTEKAFKAYNRVTHIDQHDDNAWYEQALLLKKQQKIDEAIHLLTRAHAVNNRSARINYTLSMLYYLNEHDNLAVQYFEKGLQIDSLGYEKILNDAPKIKMDQRFINLIRKYANQ